MSTEIDLGIIPESTPHVRSRQPAAPTLALEEPTPDVRSQVFAAPEATPDALAVATPDVRSQESTQLTLCLDSLGIGAMTASEFLDIGIDEMNRSFAHAVRAGAAFWATQEALRESDDDAPATFKGWLHDRGLSEQRVYELISMAKFYARLPAGQREQITKIGKSKAILLAGVPQQLMDEAVQSGRDVIGDADLMTVAELREEIRSLKKREANYDAEIERRDHLIGKLSKRTALTEFTPATEDLRAECLVMQGTCERSLLALRAAYRKATSPHEEVPERELQVNQVWITLHAIAAMALDCIDMIREEDIQPLPDRVLGPNVLTPEEAKRWIVEWNTLAGRMQAEAAVRQQQREDARPRGPGRPKKAQG